MGSVASAGSEGDIAGVGVAVVGVDGVDVGVGGVELFDLPPIIRGPEPEEAMGLAKLGGGLFTVTLRNVGGEGTAVGVVALRSTTGLFWAAFSAAFFLNNALLIRLIPGMARGDIAGDGALLFRL